MRARFGILLHSSTVDSHETVILAFNREKAFESSRRVVASELTTTIFHSLAMGDSLFSPDEPEGISTFALLTRVTVATQWHRNSVPKGRCTGGYCKFRQVGENVPTRKAELWITVRLWRLAGFSFPNAVFVRSTTTQKQHFRVFTLASVRTFSIGPYSPIRSGHWRNSRTNSSSCFSRQP